MRGDSKSACGNKSSSNATSKKRERNRRENRHKSGSGRRSRPVGDRKSKMRCGDNKRATMKRRAKSNGTKAQDWWVVLGTEPNASLETAKQAYRSKIKQYHRDRVEGRGPEFIQLASQKSKELNSALNKAKRYAQAQR
jgi:DnaJ-domain-containing protein 1